jgi:hypothetical protein
MPPIVKIVWMDAETDSGWRTAEEIEDLTVDAPCVTVGFLVRKPTKKSPFYLVANTVSADHSNGIIKIPKVWVQSVVHCTIQEIKNEKAV